jgi:hypothetical protein
MQSAVLQQCCAVKSAVAIFGTGFKGSNKSNIQTVFAQFGYTLVWGSTIKSFEQIILIRSIIEQHCYLKHEKETLCKKILPPPTTTPALHLDTT